MVNLPKLIVSQKIEVTKSPTKKVINHDKGTDVGKFVVAFLQEYSKLLPVYASETDAINIGGLDSGDIYLMSTATGNVLAFVS
jgi:hypothetical protein